MDRTAAREAAVGSAVKFLEQVRENGYRIRKAWLFGSYAGDEFREDSDVDVAIVLAGQAEPNIDVQQKLMRLAAHFFDVRIEPHPFGESDLEDGHPFLERIQRTGILLT